MEFTKDAICQVIDYSILKPNTTREEVKIGCEEAIKHNLYSVFVLPVFVPYAVKILKGTQVKVGTVVSFPHGSDLPEVKSYQAKVALESGAEEVDMVISLSSLKSSDYITVEEEIKEVVRTASGKIVKVIIECCYLTEEEKIKASEICEQAGANFIKTSTGFGEGGAEVEDVELIKRTVSKKMQIKAAGGIKTLAEVIKFLKAGADRVGTSSAIEIVKNIPTK